MTHLVLPKLVRNCQVLAALASGCWLLHWNFLTACERAHSWLEPVRLLPEPMENMPTMLLYPHIMGWCCHPSAFLCTCSRRLVHVADTLPACLCANLGNQPHLMCDVP